MTLRPRPHVLACLLLGAMLAGCRTTGAPAGVVQEFYDTYIQIRPTGLPEGAALDRLTPFLSTRLEGLIEGALDAQAAFMASHPEDKPPFVDGDFFSSLFEGPQSFTVVRTEARTDAGWNVRVRFRHEDFVWEDVVVVTMEDGRPVIDDVLFSGAGEFNPPGRLSEALSRPDE